MMTTSSAACDEPFERILCEANASHSVRNDCADRQPPTVFNDAKEELHDQTQSFASTNENAQVIVPSSASDVLLGRAGFDGELFQVTIREWAHRYKNTKNDDKWQVVDEIVADLQRRKCRFLSKHINTVVVETDKLKITNKIKRYMRMHIRKVAKASSSDSKKRATETLLADDTHDQPSSIKRHCSDYNNHKNHHQQQDIYSSSDSIYVIGENDLFKYYNDPLPEYETMTSHDHQEDELWSTSMAACDDDFRNTHIKKCLSSTPLKEQLSAMPEFNYFDDAAEEDGKQAPTGLITENTSASFSSQIEHVAYHPSTYVASPPKVSILEKNEYYETPPPYTQSGQSQCREVSPVAVENFFSAAGITMVPPPPNSPYTPIVSPIETAHHHSPMTAMMMMMPKDIACRPFHQQIPLTLAPTPFALPEHTPVTWPQNNRTPTVSHHHPATKRPTFTSAPLMGMAMIGPSPLKTTPTNARTKSKKTTTTTMTTTTKNRGPSPASLKVLNCSRRSKKLVPLAPNVSGTSTAMNALFLEFKQLEEKAKALEAANAVMVHKLLTMELSLDETGMAATDSNDSAFR